MSKLIVQVWRDGFGCDNWPVLRVPQFIGSEKLVVDASLGLNDSKISCVDLHQSGGRYDEKFVIIVSAGDYHCDSPRPG